MQKEVKRTLVAGGMFKDGDLRIVPPGYSRHAVNIRVNSAEGGDMGAGKNLLGNTKLTNLNLTNGVCIGRFADQINNLIYGFITSDDKDLIIEYDNINKKTNIILESSKPGILNFSKNFLITGINKVFNGDPDLDLLEWTDDLNPPRRLNIARAKTYGLDGFAEEDISVIKAMPAEAPEVSLTFTTSALENNMEERLLQFAYRYKYQDNEYSAISPFAYPAFGPKRFSLNFQSMENEGMVNAFNAAKITFDTGSQNVTDIQLIVKENNAPTAYIIDTFNKAQNSWGDDEMQDFTFSNNKTLVALPTADLNKAFDNVPRLAKTLCNIGSRTVYGNYLEGYDLVDANGVALAMDYDVSLNSSSLEGVVLPVSFTNGGWVDNTMQVSFINTDFIEGHAILFDFFLDAPTVSGAYENDFTYILNQDYDDAAALAQDADFISFLENIVTGGFMANFTDTPPVNGSVFSNTKFTVSGYSASTISIKCPSVTYEIDNNPSPNTYETAQWSYISDTTQVFYNETGTNSSLKSNRTYEVGIIYRDTYGRATTALTEPYNTLYIPQSASIFKNKIQVQINHAPPAWADRYQLVVKQDKGNYETIYATTFYVDGLFRWVKLEGASKDKVQEGDTLIVKSDLTGPVLDVTKVRVIELATKEQDFIADNTDENSNLIIEEAGTYMKIRPIGFNMNASDSLYEFYSDFDSRHADPNPTLEIQDFGYVDDGDVFQFYPISSGTSIRIKIESWEKDRNDNYWGYDKTFTANADYANFQAWFDAEVVDLGTFQTDHLSIVDFQDGGKIFRIRSNEGGYGWGGDRRLLGEVTINFGNLLVFETEPSDAGIDTFFESAETFYIAGGHHLGNVQNQNIGSGQAAVVELDMYNCFAMGNGVESLKIKDALNKPGANFDTRATAASVTPYGSIRHFADLTYSGTYNEESNFNGLSDFNLSLANFKNDIDKRYGSIQHVYGRDTDLIVWQEDKVHKVLFGKDLLVNADGTSNVTKALQVLGQHIAYTGEYGISKNPEGFTLDGARFYFPDAKRGCWLRLANDGLTEISSYGMANYWRDLFRDTLYKKRPAAYDPYNDELVVSYDQTDIYVPMAKMLCSETYTRTGFSGAVEIEIEYGSAIGDASVTISATSDVTYSLSWNNAVQGSGSGQLVVLPFMKTAAASTKAFLTVTATEETDLTITPSCVLAPELTIITVIVNDAGDAGKTIKNRYRFSKDGYTSPYRNFNTIFEEDGLTTYDVATGREGTTTFPPDGATVFIETYKGFADTATFELEDRIGYLLTNTIYGQNETDDIISNATFVPGVRTILPSGDQVSTGQFTFDRSAGETYLYLVYDYVDKSNAPIAADDTFIVSKGAATNINVLQNDFDQDLDPLTVSIVSNPSYGSVFVEADQTVTYTHDNSDNFDDSFTYKVSDGVLESNVATVTASIGADCGGSVNYGGGIGIYEISMVYGPLTGSAGISYNAFIIPDRFQIEYDGSIVADSKYVGSGLTGTPPSYPGLIGSFTLPVYEYDGTTFVATGENRPLTVGSGDVASGSAQEPTADTGSITFDKDFSDPRKAKIIITCPVIGGSFQVDGICPSPGIGGGEPGVAFNISASSYDPMGSSNGEGACAFSLGALKYHSGESLYPTLDDFVYNDQNKTQPFDGFSHYYAIANGRSIKINSSGRITDLYICGQGNA